MPDWIAHLGGGYLLYRPISRKDMRLVLLGAILLDIISRISSVLVDIFDVPLPRYYQLEAFHTPFMLVLMALFISLFNTKFWRCFGLILAGGILHILLDMGDTKLNGFGQLLLYPFSYKTYQLNWVKYYGGGYYIVVVILLVILISGLRKPPLNSAFFRRQRIGFAIPLLIFILAMPYLTWQQFWRNNVGYIVFHDYPERFEGQEVAIHFSEVVSAEPLIIKEDKLRFEVLTDQKFQVGDWISVRGIYSRGKIHPLKIKLESGIKKFWISLIGLILFPFIWFGAPSQWPVFGRNQSHELKPRTQPGAFY
jgi:hypothetical protein